MRIRSILGTLVIASLPAMPALAEDMSPEDIKRMVDEAVEKRLQQREQETMAEKRLEEQGQRTSPMAGPPVSHPGTGVAGTTEPRKSLGSMSEPRSLGKKYDSAMQGSGGLIYARPFVSAPKAIVGGYMDIEYINRARSANPSFFDQHRLVPFIYGDVSEHVKFAAEIEFEHGEELSVEFATIDYLINDAFNLRGGIVLLPVGKFNLLHDSPLRDLTERPLVDQRIIPSTFHQPGVGFYGTVYPSQLSQLNYEFYVTSGFTNAFGGQGNPDNTSNITATNGFRSARTSNTEFDNNNGKAVTGRVAFSPILGVEIGGSGHFGAYDPGSTRPASIVAVDWTFQRGQWELIGESAWGYARDNNLDVDGTPNGNPRRMQGYYIQMNYHFLPQWLTKLAPTHFRQDISTFTAVVRWEELHMAQDLAQPNVGDRQRLTLGLNFRPTEDTVFKTDFQYSPEEVRGNQRIHDTAFLASIATYF